MPRLSLVGLLVYSSYDTIRYTETPAACSLKDNAGVARIYVGLFTNQIYPFDHVKHQIGDD